VFSACNRNNGQASVIPADDITYNNEENFHVNNHEWPDEYGDWNEDEAQFAINYTVEFNNQKIPFAVFHFAPDDGWIRLDRAVFNYDNKAQIIPLGGREIYFDGEYFYFNVLADDYNFDGYPDINIIDTFAVNSNNTIFLYNPLTKSYRLHIGLSLRGGIRADYKRQTIIQTEIVDADPDTIYSEYQWEYGELALIRKGSYDYSLAPVITGVTVPSIKIIPDENIRSPDELGFFLKHKLINLDSLKYGMYKIYSINNFPDIHTNMEYYFNNNELVGCEYSYDLLQLGIPDIHGFLMDTVTQFNNTYGITGQRFTGLDRYYWENVPYSYSGVSVFIENISGREFLIIHIQLAAYG